MDGKIPFGALQLVDDHGLDRPAIDSLPGATGRKIGYLI
jgi:hypothetical protein